SATPLPCPAADGSSDRVDAFPAAPAECIDPAKTYTIEVDTSHGSYTAELDAQKAPLTVNSFVYLARYHYFDGTECHRVVPDFVVQCGDPTATGSGGPGYQFADELPAAGEYQVGSLAMANSGANTNGSQFFAISGQKGVELPPNFTLFGQITEGLDTIAAINALAVGDGPPSETVTINSITVTET
ncbi:MAG: peptidylprolyl isomerase, partial [Ilumatobacteraceae bacterium]